MKVFNNPWVTGALVVAAVGVVIFQVLGANSRRDQGVAPEPASRAVIAPAPLVAATGASTSTPEAALTMDRKYIEQHLGEWIDAPGTDAFGAPLAELRSPTRAAASRWHLKAIWAQTGSRVAAINNGVYSEGDHIEELTVERIRDNEVWLKGPSGRELVEFENAAMKSSDKTNVPRSSLANRQDGNPSSK
jgi:hypothetical protein